MDPILKARRFLQQLSHLRQAVPSSLCKLTYVVQPNLSDKFRLSVLETIFTDIPILLDTVSSEQLVELSRDPPVEATAFRLLLELIQIQNVLENVSVSQLLALGNFLSPSAHQPDTQLWHLTRVQECLRTVSPQQLTQLRLDLEAIPPRQEQEFLSNIFPSLILPGPTTGDGVIQVVSRVLRMDLQELVHFREWLLGLHHGHLVLFVNLLNVEVGFIIEIKKRLAPEQVRNLSRVGEKRTRDDLISAEFEQFPRKAMRTNQSCHPDSLTLSDQSDVKKQSMEPLTTSSESTFLAMTSDTGIETAFQAYSSVSQSPLHKHQISSQFHQLEQHQLEPHQLELQLEQHQELLGLEPHQLTPQQLKSHQIQQSQQQLIWQQQHQSGQQIQPQQHQHQQQSHQPQQFLQLHQLQPQQLQPRQLQPQQLQPQQLSQPHLLIQPHPLNQPQTLNQPQDT
eukprot:TRINITY_DN19939_c0_g1_i1.p1 TRINITY_DN19939_c0_g1~~TRINITY_DN19939_c0_g1_i1.p1  ORF type:complete len:452 (-),score=88.61 TRINITY_DN19939_c0_g1_i1:86-1441(-)